VADIRLAGAAAGIEAADIVGLDVVVVDATGNVLVELLLDAGAQQPARLPAVGAYGRAGVAQARHRHAGGTVYERITERHAGLGLGGQAVAFPQVATGNVDFDVAHMGKFKFAADDETVHFGIVAALNTAHEFLVAGKRIDALRRGAGVKTNIATSPAAGGSSGRLLIDGRVGIGQVGSQGGGRGQGGADGQGERLHSHAHALLHTTPVSPGDGSGYSGYKTARRKRTPPGIRRAAPQAGSLSFSRIHKRSLNLLPTAGPPVI